MIHRSTLQVFLLVPVQYSDIQPIV